MGKRAKFCNDEHRVKFRNGQKLDGGTLVPVQAMADASFCPWCGAYVPNENERAIGVRGKLCTFTPYPDRFPDAVLSVEVLRVGVLPNGAVFGDLRLYDGSVLPREALAGRLADRGSRGPFVLEPSIG